MRHNKALIKLYAGFGLLAFVIAGCASDDWEEQKERESRIIQQYLRDNNITEDQKTEGGIYIVELEKGTGRSPLRDNFVVINYVGRYLENGSIHETNLDSLKSQWSGASYYPYFIYAPLRFRYGYSIAGLNEGLAMMQEGGKAKLIIPSDKAFYDFNPLVYEVELIEVMRDPAAYEDSILAAYVEKESYDASTMMSGIYFRETFTPNPDDPETVEPGDTVLFRFEGRYVTGYGGRLSDTVVFDSNMEDQQPIKMVFGSRKSLSGVILAIPDGLVTALDSMRTGTRATAVLPYSEAFGAGGLVSGTYGYTIVPPYQTVLYDLVVEEIRSPLGK